MTITLVEEKTRSPSHQVRDVNIVQSRGFLLDLIVSPYRYFRHWGSWSTIRKEWDILTQTFERLSQFLSDTDPNISLSEASSVRGVKKPVFASASTSHQSSKRPYVSRKDNDLRGKGLGVFPIGPPLKKRCRENEKNMASGASESKKKGTQSFADSLGAAINQARQGATEVQTNGSSSSILDHSRRHESTTETAAAPSKMASLTSHNSQVKTPTQNQVPISVSVADLQDMVVKTADRVVRQIVGDAPHMLLTSRAAVSMMTGYAASGQFINNNTQLQFPSVCSAYLLVHFISVWDSFTSWIISLRHRWCLRRQSKTVNINEPWKTEPNQAVIIKFRFSLRGKYPVLSIITHRCRQYAKFF